MHNPPSQRSGIWVRLTGLGPNATRRVPRPAPRASPAGACARSRCARSLCVGVTARGGCGRSQEVADAFER
jgi:hypothetical protein